MDNDVIEFLKKCNLQLENEAQLDGQLIPRDILLSLNIYENVKPEIMELKKKFSSSALTSLQNGAEKGQKWPLLNLVRQILRVCNYKMEPIRKSNGYDEDGNIIDNDYQKCEKHKKCRLCKDL